MDDRKPPQPPADRGRALIAAAIIGGALVLSWGMGREEPRYQLVGAGDTIVRMSNDSGEMIACNQQGCTQVQAPDRAQVLGPLRIETRAKVKKVEAPADPATNEAAR
ncbi:MAG: hypothetical protein ACREBK_02020 [Sphingomicrobium sp.]